MKKARLGTLWAAAFFGVAMCMANETGDVREAIEQVAGLKPCSRTLTAGWTPVKALRARGIQECDWVAEVSKMAEEEMVRWTTCDSDVQGDMHPDGRKLRLLAAMLGEASSNAGGLYTSVGMLISTGAADRTLAHEILHACGADDLYWESKNHVVQLTDMVEENSQPDDWGRYSLDDGQVMPQSNIVQRLLMHGKSTPIKGDIPTGRVYGLQKWRVGGQLAYGAGMCFVGLSAMTNTPISH